MTDVAIELAGVTLWRRTQEELTYDLKRLLFSVLKHGFRAPRRRRTLDAVSFTVARGEKLGVIGDNGSGKSTILKLIGGILRPTEGQITVRGSVAPLIELGAGFDPELSVEDNIVLNGILLGHPRQEMLPRVDRILDFAELQDHRRAPFKNLSSGMGARLGFAVATDVRPDVLLVDEILSVGDMSFRQRSQERLQQVWTEHTTIVLVSHDITFVASQCERVLWIENGTVRAIGPAQAVTQRYLLDVTERQRLGHGATLPFAEAAPGHIDVARVDRGRLAVRGWALLPSATRGARVAILVDGRVVGDAAYGDLRPDVAASSNNDDNLTSGFHGDVPLHDIVPGEHRISAAIYDPATEIYHETASFPLTVPPETA